jgi:predicted DNA binding CopG/RHH family protein
MMVISRLRMKLTTFGIRSFTKSQDIKKFSLFRNSQKISFAFSKMEEPINASNIDFEKVGDCKMVNRHKKSLNSLVISMK